MNCSFKSIKINNLNFISCLLLARVYTVGPIVSLSAAVNRCCSMYHLGATVSVLPSLTDVTLLSTTTLKQLQSVERKKKVHHRFRRPLFA